MLAYNYDSGRCWLNATLSMRPSFSGTGSLRVCSAIMAAQQMHKDYTMANAQSFGKLGAVLRRESERGGGAVPCIK